MTDPMSEKQCGVNVLNVLVVDDGVAHLEVLEHVPSLGAVEGEHEAPGHEGGLDVSELQLVQGQHELLVFLLECKKY